VNRGECKLPGQLFHVTDGQTDDETEIRITACNAMNSTSRQQSHRLTIPKTNKAETQRRIITSSGFIHSFASAHLHYAMN